MEPCGKSEISAALCHRGVIHGVWDTDLPLPMVVKNGLLTAVIWTILLYYINLGLKQLEEAKKRSAVSD